jgi:hypothetical protein
LISAVANPDAGLELVGYAGQIGLALVRQSSKSYVTM